MIPQRTSFHERIANSLAPSGSRKTDSAPMGRNILYQRAVTERTKEAGREVPVRLSYNCPNISSGRGSAERGIRSQPRLPHKVEKSCAGAIINGCRHNSYKTGFRLLREKEVESRLHPRSAQFLTEEGDYAAIAQGSRG